MNRAPRGFALITVLLGVAILALIAAVILSSVRVSSGAVHGQILALQVRTIDEAAVVDAVLALTDHRADHRPRVDGVPRMVQIQGIPVEVTIQDEYGRIDLNQADGAVFRRLFESAGLNSPDAASLTDKVLDWREPGPGKRLNGATEDEYRDAGYAYRPRRGPFQAVDELKLVMGMTSDLFDRIRPALTIYTGRPGVNLATAPLEVLLAELGYDRQKALDALAARAKGQTAASGPVTNGRIDPAIPLAGWPFTIRTVLTIGERRFVHETVIRLTADPTQPYWVLRTGYVGYGLTSDIPGPIQR